MMTGTRVGDTAGYVAPQIRQHGPAGAGVVEIALVQDDEFVPVGAFEFESAAGALRTFAHIGRMPIVRRDRSGGVVDLLLGHDLVATWSVAACHARWLVDEFFSGERS